MRFLIDQSYEKSRSTHRNADRLNFDSCLGAAVRLYSTAAPAASESLEAGEIPKKAPKVPDNVYSSIVLSRIPIVTPEPTEFEKTYYNYQSELEKRLMWTFPAHFYFKKGSLSERKFVAAQRGPVTRQPGVWFPKGIPDIKFNRERTLKQEIVIPREKGPEGEASSDSVLRPIVGNPRITEADKTGDVKALTRCLDRTIYLLVNENGQGWKFPSFNILESEGLHESAERGVREIGGPNMHTWTVSNTPCAVVRYGDANRGSVLSENFDQAQSKEYFIKSHIIHGKFVPKEKGLEFAWLAKDEIKEKVTPEYWNQVNDILSNQ